MLRDLVFNHPEFILAGCLAWFIVAGWVLLLVQRMVMADIDTLTGTIGIFTVIGLGLMSIHAPKPFLQPLSIVMLYLSGILIPIVRGIYNKREKRNTEVEAIRQAYEGFVLRPNNPAAQIRLARHLYTMGVRGHAFVLAENALPGLPRQFFPDEYRMVDQWRQYPIPQEEFEPIACTDCGTKNPAGTTHCMRCGARYLLNRVQGKAMPAGLARRLLAAWIVMVMSLVGIPFATSLAPVPALIVIIGLMVLSFGAVIAAVRTGDSKA